MVIEGPERIAVFGGVYSNYLALEAAIRDARRQCVKSLELRATVSLACLWQR